MSSLPTLMLKGKLVPPTDDTSQKAVLDEWIPYLYILEWFKQRLSTAGVGNKVLILKSETASGKSTLLPPEIYKAFVMNKMGAGGIICTQPRVLTAIDNVGEMLRFNPRLRRGENIGWSTQYNKLRPKKAGLLSATIGTLMQELRTTSDEDLIKKYRFIMIDETHERNLQTDISLYMLKSFLYRNAHNPACPFVVLMSATFDPDPILRYFGVKRLTNFIWCRGETAGFDEMWDWNSGRTVNNYTRAAADVVERIVRENADDPIERADILIFMPGRPEFKETVRWLNKVNKKLADEEKRVFSILEIDGPAVSSQNIDYRKLEAIPTRDHVVEIDGHKYKPGRRVIISTVVAETGLNLANLKYVIDSGYNREIEFNPIHGIRALLTKPAPKSRIQQRRGRAGRKFRGVFYPLYPQYIHQRLPELQYPDILVDDPSEIMCDIINEQLKVKTLARMADPEFLIDDIDMVDVPTPDALTYSMNKLYTLGNIGPIAPPWNADRKIILDSDEVNRFGLTKLGVLCNAIGLQPEPARMIIAAYFWDCAALDLITIAAYLAIGPKTFLDRKEMSDEIKWTEIFKHGFPNCVSNDKIIFKMRLYLADNFIMGIILFNAIKYQINTTNPKETITNFRSFCSKTNLKFDVCLNFIKARDEIINQMLGNEFDAFYMEQQESLFNANAENFTDVITKIKYCIYEGYRNNLLVRENDVYRTTTGLAVVNPKIFQENEKTIAERDQFGFVIDVLPKYLLYDELSIKYNRKTEIYNVIVNNISTMDGIVNLDIEFAN